jgi:6-phosphogluconolactonase (cycloisomerase 2 family)
VDSSGAVHVFTIDSTSAGFSLVGTSEPAGDGASPLGDGVSLMAMDPSGHFVIVAQSSEGGFLSTPDRLTIFAFDPASGAMRKLQSYPMNKSPFRIAFVAE